MMSRSTRTARTAGLLVGLALVASGCTPDATSAPHLVAGEVVATEAEAPPSTPHHAAGEVVATEADAPPSAPAGRVLQAGAPGAAPQPVSARELDDLALPAHTAGDVAFVNDMLHHHAQALEMTALVESRSTSERVRLLAERMELSQEAETEQMLAWLSDRGEDAPGHHGGMHHEMPGILTAAQMDALAAADGAAFDRLFLESMTYHHQGALDMVEALYVREDGSGQDQDVFNLASHVNADQRIEIDRMADLHAALATDD